MAVNLMPSCNQSGFSFGNRLFQISLPGGMLLVILVSLLAYDAAGIPSKERHLCWMTTRIARHMMTWEACHQQRNLKPAGLPEEKPGLVQGWHQVHRHGFRPPGRAAQWSDDSRRRPAGFRLNRFSHCPASSGHLPVFVGFDFNASPICQIQSAKPNSIPAKKIRCNNPRQNVPAGRQQRARSKINSSATLLPPQLFAHRDIA